MIFSTGRDPEGQGESETGRLEAFSDGVLAVIITIMALELKAPVEGTFASLRERLPALLVYIVSFTFIGIYWNNHHHLLRAARRVTGAVMWANLHLLFWLSLIPVLTEWVGEHYAGPRPGRDLRVRLPGLPGWRSPSWSGRSSAPTAAPRWSRRPSGGTPRAMLSLAGYAAATALAFVSPWISYALIVAVAVLWFVPDRRFTS